MVNAITHQALVADEFGQNFKLIQLPSAPVNGALNNNGQPGSGTMPDAASLFTIAAAVTPMGDVNGTPTLLGMIGDPNSLTVDPNHNLGFALADPIIGGHVWQGGTTTPLFLFVVDLSKPVFGASPTMPTHWLPNTNILRMP